MPQYPYYMPQYQQTRRKAEFIQGRVAAEAYPVYAGEEVFLIDMDNPVVYRKARGFDNLPEPMETYDMMPHMEQAPPQETIITEEMIDKKIADEVERRLAEARKPKRTQKEEE